MTNFASSTRTPLPVFRLIPLASLLIIVSASGCANTKSCLTAFCAPYEATKGTCTTERQARRVAREIWDCHHAQCYLNNCNYKEVREGFIDGFVSTCSGGNTCPPMFAPAKHSLCGLNKRCSTAWHEGWPLGSVAAESSGFCNSSCSRAHPCLRGPKLPCNPGCVKCGVNASSLDDHGGYIIEHYGEPAVITEEIHINDPSATNAYEAPIEDPATPLIEQQPPVAPAPPAVPAQQAPAAKPSVPAIEASAPTEAAPAPTPPAPAPVPDSTKAAQPFSLRISLSEETTPAKTAVAVRQRVQPAVPAESIAGLQDAETRIASLIERFQPDAASRDRF